MQAGFEGFPPEAMSFFRGLARNNRREWFQPRKELFDQHVKEPMLNLVTAINGELARFAPDYVTEPSKAIFRIYRDTRFSHDKTPYKDHIAASFGPRGLQKKGAGSFFFSVNHKEIEIAGGVYHPSSEAMLTIRTHISGTHKEFRRLLANRKLRGLLGELKGAALSRVPKGFEATHPAADLIKHKDWILFDSIDPVLATSPGLVDALVARFRAVAPVLDYLNKPLQARKTPASHAVFPF